MTVNDQCALLLAKAIYQVSCRRSWPLFPAQPFLEDENEVNAFLGQADDPATAWEDSEDGRKRKRYAEYLRSGR